MLNYEFKKDIDLQFLACLAMDPGHMYPEFFRVRRGKVYLHHSGLAWLRSGFAMILGARLPHRFQWGDAGNFEAVNAAIELALYLSSAPYGLHGTSAASLTLHTLYADEFRRREAVYMSEWATRVVQFLHTLGFCVESPQPQPLPGLDTEEGVHTLCLNLLTTASSRLTDVASQGQRLPAPADDSTLRYCLRVATTYYLLTLQDPPLTGSAVHTIPFSIFARMVATQCNRTMPGVSAGARRSARDGLYVFEGVALLDRHHSEHSLAVPRSK